MQNDVLQYNCNVTLSYKGALAKGFHTSSQSIHQMTNPLMSTYTNNRNHNI